MVQNKKTTESMARQMTTNKLTKMKLQTRTVKKMMKRNKWTVMVSKKKKLPATGIPIRKWRLKLAI